MGKREFRIRVVTDGNNFGLYYPEYRRGWFFRWWQPFYNMHGCRVCYRNIAEAKSYLLGRTQTTTYIKYP